MKIISWNVNGIRALHRKEQFAWLMKKSPDIFCLQETKAHIHQLDPELVKPDGYNSFFSSHEIKKGYSGVATYTKAKPDDVETHLDGGLKDDEGRILTLFFGLPAAPGTAQAGKISISNIYFPNGGGGPLRLAYKLKFYDAFLEYIVKLKREGYSVIFCGDVNTAHEEIDLARPKDNETRTGFLPEERAWIDEVVNAGFTDVFRHLNPKKKDVYTYWDMKTRARERNVGWRIDYFFVSPDLVGKVKGFTTYSDVLGSDHCPIELDLDIELS